MENNVSEHDYFELKQLCQKVYESITLSNESKIKILNEILLQIRNIKCYRNGNNKCPFPSTYYVDVRTGKKTAKIVCFYEDDIKFSENSGIKTVVFSSDCVINMVEECISTLINELNVQMGTNKNCNILRKIKKEGNIIFIE